MDMVYFGNILKQIPGIYGFDAEYSCPVTVKLYADPSAELSEKLLKDSIEVEQTHMLAAGGKVRWFPVDYKLVSYERNGDRISSREFVEPDVQAYGGDVGQVPRQYEKNSTAGITKRRFTKSNTRRSKKR